MKPMTGMKATIPYSEKLHANAAAGRRFSSTGFIRRE
jgi:hypothetical protein